MKQDRHIQRDFENCHSLCRENSGTSYYWNIVLYLAAKVYFLHESCCCSPFVKISPSLIYIHMKNDLAVMGGNEAVRVAISTLSGHVPQETAYSQCRSSLEALVSVATQCASLFQFGCEDQRQEVEMIPHSQLKKKKKKLPWFYSRFKHLLRVQLHLKQAHNKLESQWYH